VGNGADSGSASCCRGGSLLDGVARLASNASRRNPWSTTRPRVLPPRSWHELPGGVPGTGSLRRRRHNPGPDLGGPCAHGGGPRHRPVEQHHRHARGTSGKRCLASQHRAELLASRRPVHARHGTGRAAGQLRGRTVLAARLVAEGFRSGPGGRHGPDRPPDRERIVQYQGAVAYETLACALLLALGVLPAT
jgi:hypothetical protein